MLLNRFAPVPAATKKQDIYRLKTDEKKVSRHHRRLRCACSTIRGRWRHNMGFSLSPPTVSSSSSPPHQTPLLLLWAFFLAAAAGHPIDHSHGEKRKWIIVAQAGCCDRTSYTLCMPWGRAAAVILYCMFSTISFGAQCCCMKFKTFSGMDVSREIF